MSKQRAQRRVQRLASQQQEAKAAREAKQARARQRREQRRATRGDRGRTRRRVGFAGLRRSRQQRIGITAVAVGGVALLWILVALSLLDAGLAIALTVLFLVALPAIVVLAIGRRY